VCFAHIDDLPEEAARDKEILRRFGPHLDVRKGHAYLQQEAKVQGTRVAVGQGRNAITKS
jgi:hypothetical protein